MRPVEVDAVGSEPFQAGFYRSHHVLAAVAAAGDAARPTLNPEGILGGHYEVVAVSPQEVAHQFFGLAKLIGVGGIEKVTARLGVAIEYSAGLGRLGTVAPARAEHAHPQRQLGDAQAGFAAKYLVVHGVIGDRSHRLNS